MVNFIDVHRIINRLFVYKMSLIGLMCAKTTNSLLFESICDKERSCQSLLMFFKINFTNSANVLFNIRAISCDDKKRIETKLLLIDSFKIEWECIFLCIFNGKLEF